MPNGVALARIAPFSGWKVSKSSNGRAVADTASARDFALSSHCKRKREKTIFSWTCQENSVPTNMLHLYGERVIISSRVLPKSMSKINTLAPLILAPNASALPAPPAPTRINCVSLSGETRQCFPFSLSLYCWNVVNPLCQWMLLIYYYCTYLMYKHMKWVVLVPVEHLPSLL